MKQYSPIVLFFILVLYSCNENKTTLKKQNAIGDSINSAIEKSKNQSLETERLASSNKAFVVAKQSKEDSLIYKALYNKIQTDVQLQKQDSIDFYLEKLKKISKKISHQAGYYYLKGFSLQGKDAENSFANYEKSQKLYSSIGDWGRAGYNLMMMSEIQRTAADYVGAENTMTEALKYLQESKKYNNHIYNVFGLIYKGLYDYENALYYYKKALQITDAKNTQAKNIVLNNIAVIYMDKKDYENSIKVLDSLNTSYSLNSDPIMKAKVLSNLGYSIFLSKKGDGLSYLKQAEKIQDSTGDFFGSLSNYLNLSDAYQEKNKVFSKEYAAKAYALAEKLHNGEDKLRALELLSKATNEKRESDQLFGEYILLNDSITKARQIAKNQFSKIRYDSSQKEKEALQAKAESAESKLLAAKTQRRNGILLLAIVGLIITIFYSYRHMKKRNAKGRKEEAYATETRISKKVHDELANDIYNAMMFAGTQEFSSEEKKERLLNDLDNVYKRTRDISKENATIETGENFPEQLIGMLSEYQNEHVNVVHSGAKEIAWGKMEAIKKVAIYRVLQELMVNMAKHSQASVCLLAFKTNGRTIEIYYSDNGIGIGTEKIVFKNGLANAENRIIGIGGSFTFDPSPEKGLKITIVFPA